MTITRLLLSNPCAIICAALLVLSSQDGRAQSTPKRVALNMVYNNLSVGSGPLWVAQNAGIFQKHGLDMTLSLARGSLSVQAMLAGSFPVGIPQAEGSASGRRPHASSRPES